jgi:hypothetical protein
MVDLLTLATNLLFAHWYEDDGKVEHVRMFLDLAADDDVERWRRSTRERRRARVSPSRRPPYAPRMASARYAGSIVPRARRPRQE